MVVMLDKHRSIGLIIEQGVNTCGYFYPRDDKIHFPIISCCPQFSLFREVSIFLITKIQRKGGMYQW